MMPHDVLQRIQQVHQERGPKIMALWLQDMYILLGFSHKAAKLLIREQGVDRTERPRVLTNKNIDDICKFMRMPGGKNADGKPDRGQQISFTAHKYMTPDNEMIARMSHLPPDKNKILLKSDVQSTKPCTAYFTDI